MERAGRKIIHVDMDAFYASVEILDNPRYAGLPLVVGGPPNSRGVVCAASYKAREFGVRSAMPCSQAAKLCPSALFVPPRFERYKEVSGVLHDVFHEFTDLVEPLSLDEAWLDVTENKPGLASATRLAERLKAAVRRETGLTCSAGVSYNKFLAKIASDWRKPDGLFVITPESAQAFLMDLEVGKFPGVGPVTRRRLAELGVTHGRHLVERDEDFLVERFGKQGASLARRARGIDHSEVAASRERKSIGAESTFSHDLPYGPELLAELERLAAELEGRARRKALAGRTLTLKVKFADFHQVTRSATAARGAAPFSERGACRRVGAEKLAAVCLLENPGRAVRLLGLGLHNLEPAGRAPAPAARHTQLDFYHLLE